MAKEMAFSPAHGFAAYAYAYADFTGTVNIRLPSGATTAVKTASDETIDALAVTPRETKGLLPEGVSFELLWEAPFLRNVAEECRGKTLRELNITEGATLHLVIQSDARSDLQE